ncbi:hypothetical protein M427DRAFT_52125 [Gonapodya prolifera JEL478]|uniref:GTP-binding protein n=1 Tax=Gonapodya prolifera (strain JEL478) TaxID=1344416 RepID=A0A139AUZ7_GONPJ|nr:hypothetical protein M427DRAFT_52125 [Gonapodya prolifera JEL478]|eukprot:KXS20524.1 hypothetical protein M427DRAFT_52125 [Gonapodya prolifera JEL478]
MAYRYERPQSPFPQSFGPSSFPVPSSMGQQPLDPTNGGRPRLLLMGLRRAGKSSILRVVFHKMSPNETLFLESTSKVFRTDVFSFIDFEVWDFPGTTDPRDETWDPESVFRRTGALVFIIDAQDDYSEALSLLYSTVEAAYHVNPRISFEVFVHKADGLSDDMKVETQRDIQHRITEELIDAGLDTVHVSFYLTSIYDRSVFEALSKVMQKLVKELPTLENLLNILCSTSAVEKAFLFDVLSKIYIATDSSPYDLQTYELCSDMIDVVIDIGAIYSASRAPTSTLPRTSTAVARSSGLSQRYQVGHKGGLWGHEQGVANAGTDRSGEKEDGDESRMYDEEGQAVIRLNNGTILYLRQVDRHLALVALIREDSFERQGLVDFNFRVFREAVVEVFTKDQDDTAVQSRRTAV